jgi:hypothetical protein
MSSRFLVSLGAMVGVLGVASVPVVTQNRATATQLQPAWTQHLTPWGEPDLQGIWANVTSTPLETPRAWVGKTELTDEERAKADERALRAHLSRDSREQAPGAVTDTARAYNAHWFPLPGKALNRPSLIIDPPDGRVPPLKPEALKRFAAWASATGRTGSAASPAGREEGVEDGTEGGTDGRGQRADNPEDRRLSERCLTFGLPRLPGGYNNHFRIVQSAGYVMIEIEMIHEARVIPLDGRPHLPPSVRQWLGDPRGHWEGKTLVVDTTNFTDQTPFRGSFDSLHLVERFTRVDADTIDYQVTVDDPTTFTRPWTIAFPLTTPVDPIPQMYEYACHEGNYGLTGQLAGSRAMEKEAASRTATKPSR